MPYISEDIIMSELKHLDYLTDSIFKAVFIPYYSQCVFHIPGWAHVADVSGHWRTDTECSPLQPTAQPDCSAAMLSSLFCWRDKEHCQRGRGQNQRWQVHRAGRLECQQGSLAICETQKNYLWIISNSIFRDLNSLVPDGNLILLSY